MRRIARSLVPWFVVVLCCPLPTPASADRAVGLAQLAPPDGCVTDSSIASCTAARALVESVLSPVVVSPDGRHVYQGSNGGVTIFSRDPMTGALSQSSGAEGCVTAWLCLPSGCWGRGRSP
jgi:hypothetical protein